MLPAVSIKIFASFCPENVRAEPSVSGAASVHEGKVLHLSALSHPGQGRNGNRVPLQRFSQRRRGGLDPILMV
jgi:hypothetical protein